MAIGLVMGKKSSNNIINNDTMSDNKVVASYVPRGTCYTRKGNSSFSIRAYFDKILHIISAYQELWVLV